MAKSTRRQRPAHPPARRKAPQRGGRPPARPGPGRPWVRVAVPAAVIVVIVAVLALVATTGGSGGKKTSSGPDRVAASATILSQINDVPASAFDQVGVPTSDIAGPTRISGGKALTSEGLPQIVYVGDEWCPICASDRWPLAVALARFGRFSHLNLTKSASDDSYPNTNTLSFAGASYTSPYLTFSPVEMQTRTRQNLETPTALQNSLETSLGHNTVPLVDFGGLYYVNGAPYDPAVLSDMTWPSIAAALATPSDSNSRTVQRDVLGVANLYSAAICKLTGGQPGPVCTSEGVQLATAALAGKG